MDIQNELALLRAENDALQAVLAGLCFGLCKNNEVNREIVAQAFDFAHGAVRTRADLHNGASGEQEAQCLAPIIERMRTEAIGRFGSAYSRF